MRTLWNEGRVVGYSAYEIYVQKVAEADPTAIPATEKQWLSSSIAAGSSMLVWIEPDDISGQHYRDIQFPESCKLCAANVILASMFVGEGGEVDENGWATIVKSFGNLISNTSSSSPSGTVNETGTIPVVDNGNLSQDTITQLYDYMKVTDGIVIQPGTWTLNDNAPPQMNLSPNLNKRPRLRISFADTVLNGFWLLLTGFTNRTIIGGITGIRDVVGEPSADGEFLGPGTFPWSAKVVFSISPALMNYTSNINYTRQLPIDSDDVTVVSSPIIDMGSVSPETYYEANYEDSAVDATVSALNVTATSASILTVYQADLDLPPALYGSNLAAGFTGEATICPLDTVAPGSVKVYDTKDMAEALESNVPNNIGMFRDSDLIVYQINTDVTDVDNPKRYVPISEDNTIDLASLMLYSTKYLWFFSLAPGGGNPTQTDLQDVRGLNGIQVLSGYVSDAFINTYCVDYATAIAACADGHLGDARQLQKSYINQIVAEYGSTSATNDYRYFFIIQYSRLTSGSGQGKFIPVNIRTHKLEVTLTNERTINVSHGVNFSDSSIVVGDVTVPNTNAIYIGGFWDLGDSTSTSVSQHTDDGVSFVFEDHPVLHNVITQYDLFAYPYTGVPKAPTASYGTDFIKWFESTPVTTMLSAETLEVMGIHSDYLSLDTQTFLQYAATGRDMTIAMSEVSADAVIPYVQYIYAATDITAVADAGWDWSSAIKADIQFTAPRSQFDFYKPAMITLYAITVADDGTVTIGNDITSEVKNSAYHIWASSGQSGKHVTTSVSLSDSFGGLLPLTGSTGTIEASTLKWSDLMAALGQNQSIDLLGDGLRGMKGSGTNFLELGNSMRLYIASSAPTGTIPEGSVGIGWGSGVHIYTSGNWS